MTFLRTAFTVSALALLAACSSTSDRGMTEQRELLTSARNTVQKMVDSNDFPQLRSYMQRSKAVLIVPNYYKAGFVLGGEYGNGVLIAQMGDGHAQTNNASSGDSIVRGGPAPAVITAPTPRNQPIQTEELKPQSLRVLTGRYAYTLTDVSGKGWGDPLFFNISGASFGLQIGGQASEMVLTIMTEKGLNALLNRSVKLGADLSVAVGPFGQGAGASTGIMPPAADVYAFSRAAGLYGGAALNGTVLSEKTAWNMAVYGPTPDPKQVLKSTGQSQLTEVQSLNSILP